MPSLSYPSVVDCVTATLSWTNSYLVPSPHSMYFATKSGKFDRIEQRWGLLPLFIAGSESTSMRRLCVTICPWPNLKSTQGKLLIMLIGIEVLPTILVLWTPPSIGRIQGSTYLLYMLMLLFGASPDGQCELGEVKEMVPSGLEVDLEDTWWNVRVVWRLFNLPSGLDTIPFRKEGIWHHNFCQ